jgi:hypothetical protein
LDQSLIGEDCSAPQSLKGGGGIVALGLELGDALLRQVVEVGDVILQKLASRRSLLLLSSNRNLRTLAFHATAGRVSPAWQ